MIPFQSAGMWNTLRRKRNQWLIGSPKVQGDRATKNRIIYSALPFPETINSIPNRRNEEYITYYILLDKPNLLATIMKTISDTLIHYSALINLSYNGLMPTILSYYVSLNPSDVSRPDTEADPMSIKTRSRTRAYYCLYLDWLYIPSID